MSRATPRPAAGDGSGATPAGMGGTTHRWLRLRLALFHRIHRFDQAVQARLTAAGRFVLYAWIAAAVLGVNTLATRIHHLYALLTALLATALVLAAALRVPVRAERRLPRHGTAGVPLEYTVRLYNTAGHPIAGLSLLDRLHAAAPTAAQFRHHRDPQERRRNRFDRMTGYLRWRHLAIHARGGTIPELPVPSLPAHGRLDLRMRLLPLRRGRLRFDRLGVARADPLGLIRRIRWSPEADSSCLILPPLHPVRPPHLGGHRSHQPGCLTAAKVGELGEFVGLRDYRPGDPVKTIHWKSWARRNTPVVKELQEEYLPRHALWLDTHPGDGTKEPFEAAVSAAASLAVAGSGGEGLLDLVLAGDRPWHFTAGRGADDLLHLLEVLAVVEPAAPALEAVEAILHAHLEARSGLIAVVLAWDAPRHGLLRRIEAGGVGLEVLWIAPERALPAAPWPMAPNHHRIDPRHLRRDLARL